MTAVGHTVTNDIQQVFVADCPRCGIRVRHEVWTKQELRGEFVQVPRAVFIAVTLVDGGREISRYGHWCASPWLALVELVEEACG